MDVTEKDNNDIVIPEGHKINLCYGGGVDSTAMLIAMKRQGIALQRKSESLRTLIENWNFLYINFCGELK